MTARDMTLFLFSAAVAAAASAVAGEWQTLSEWRFSRDGGKNWETVSVPHDWAIAGPFDPAHDMQKVKILENGEERETEKTGRTGALPWLGRGEYSCKVKVPEGVGYAALVFDGVMSECEVYIDGGKSC